MRLPHGTGEEDTIGRKRFAVILSRPENFENVGLVARAMKNTGFSDLRLVGIEKLGPGAERTAIHATGILKKARFYPDLLTATKSLHLVFASTARFRNTFSILTFPEALETVFRYPRTTRIGLVFGNERTGLTSEELGSANFVFSLPQASRQPSYNLASAVLLTLFALFNRSMEKAAVGPLDERPLARSAQDECVRIVLMKLEKNGFIHGANRAHVTEMVEGLFGRLALTDRDKRFLMAVFHAGTRWNRIKGE